MRLGLVGTTVAMLALAGCGDIHARSIATPTPSPYAGPVAATVNVVTDPATIGRYDPTPVKIKVGQAVQWTFADTNPHSVTADGGTFDSLVHENGEQFAVKFDTAGTFAYHCSIHASMHGIVVVTQ